MAYRYSKDSSQSEMEEYLRIFEIGPNLTELWPKPVCPYLGASAENGQIVPIIWANDQIFDPNLHYKISRHKIHNFAGL